MFGLAHVQSLILRKICYITRKSVLTRRSRIVALISSEANNCEFSTQKMEAYFAREISKSSLLYIDDYEKNSNGSISSEEEVLSGSESDQRARMRTHQEIWEPDAIWSSLSSLNDIEGIMELISSGDLTQVLHLDNERKTSTLLASWIGNETLLQLILEQTPTTDIFDKTGRSPQHLAAYAGNTECLRLLLEHGAFATTWDNVHRATPLHCAASQGHLECVRLLIKYGADVNAGITTRSALHYAVQSVAVDCVKELLQAGAIPNTPQIFTETPLHVAATISCPEILTLLIKHGAAVSVQWGAEKTTALHLAVKDGDVESTRILLKAGALVTATNRKQQTPLHLATLGQATDIIELLLSHGADPNVGDVDGRTPLHGAVAKSFRYSENVQMLLSAGASVNKPDVFGYTPLHTAALNELSQVVLMLINHGGDVTSRTNGGISVLTFITRRTPDVIPKYVETFDYAIKLNDHELGDVDCELKLDFRSLVPSFAKGETELLLNFIEVGHREILKHPLCETFLFLKWKRIRKFFLFSLLYHSLFVLLYTGYTVGVFLRDCPHSSTQALSAPCNVPRYVKIIGYALICLNIVVVGKELFQIAHNWCVYVNHWENWLQWSIIISVFLCVFPSFDMNVSTNVQTWQHHVAAVGIFLAWLELMMIVGRFPIFGLYVQMFTTVALNFVKFLLAYSCLLVAFGLSFGVLFANYPAFQKLSWGLLKTVIMMSGELEFEDVFYTPDYPILYPITAHLMLFLFVLLMTLILSNLMVGLAVSDIQGLQKSAGLDRLVRQTELVAHLESMLFSRLLRCAPRSLHRFFYRQALLLKSQHRWALYVRPNDPREERIPRDLIKDIYELVAKRKERQKNRCKTMKKSTKRKCDENEANMIGRYNCILNKLEEQKEEIMRKLEQFEKCLIK